MFDGRNHQKAGEEVHVGQTHDEETRARQGEVMACAPQGAPDPAPFPRIPHQQLQNVFTRFIMQQLVKSAAVLEAEEDWRKWWALNMAESLARRLAAAIAGNVLKLPRPYFLLPEIRLDLDDQYSYGPDLAILCLRCGMVSYNPNDIAQRYCGRCHLFLEDLPC